jgi:hypothetical protein
VPSLDPVPQLKDLPQVQGDDAAWRNTIISKCLLLQLAKKAFQNDLCSTCKRPQAVRLEEEGPVTSAVTSYCHYCGTSGPQNSGTPHPILLVLFVTPSHWILWCSPQTFALWTAHITLHGQRCCQSVVNGRPLGFST